MDGTVAYLDFSLDELGDPLNEEEKVRHIFLGYCLSVLPIPQFVSGGR